MTIVPRTVLHGVDQSFPSEAKRPANPNMAAGSYQEDVMGERLRDSNKGKWIPRGGVLLPFLYDFSVHGGAVGDINLGEVPAGFVCLNAVVDVITTLTSAADTATVALKVEAANDIVAAIAINNGGNPWDAGLHQGVPDWATIGDAVKATIDRQLVMSIGVQAVTAGKMRIFLQGAMSTTW